MAGRVALVSGAASGIGLAIARRFAEEGARVIATDRAAEGLAAALPTLAGGADRHRSLVMDVTEEAGWREAAALVEREFGQLDVLVNNAGYGTFRSIRDTSFEAWRAIIAVNLDSVFLATRELMPLLERSGRGSIINMSSIRGIVAGNNASSYSAAKGGVRMLTKCIAVECAELGNGVRANSLHPGHIATPLTAATYADPGTARAFLAHTPLRRFGQPEEIAAAALFLASDESAYMTGAELVIDGGMTAI
ncbi:MAG: glucose 1-dehydrogenase [Sphingomonadales bacterium]|nr:glucose 1-dehydrogenase [Sphingomonadales bacterium]